MSTKYPFPMHEAIQKGVLVDVAKKFTAVWPRRLRIWNRSDDLISFGYVSTTGATGRRNSWTDCDVWLKKPGQDFKIALRDHALLLAMGITRWNSKLEFMFQTLHITIK